MRDLAEPAGGGSPDPSGRDASRRLVIVSFLGGVAGTPRGERTQALARGLAASWDVEVLTGPPAGGSSRPARRRRTARRAARRLRDTVLIDKYEPWSRRRLSAWSPRADLALIVAPPFSFAAHAAQRLARAGVPWVLDIGDPWASGMGRTPAARRSRRGESLVWGSAAGGIVTTPEQADEVARRFPAVALLVRPNGFDPRMESVGVARPAPAGAPGTLRVAHFGHLYSSRIGLAPFAAGLRASGLWDGIELHLYGEDWDGMLAAARRHVTVVEHEPLPWRRVVEIAGHYDAAVVVGNRGGVQLPSKVVQYLTLPVPRVAVVEDPTRDCIAAYVRDKPGWLICGAADPETARMIHAHCAREWRPSELRAPAEEAWPYVTRTIDAFLRDVRVRASGRAA